MAEKKLIPPEMNPQIGQIFTQGSVYELAAAYTFGTHEGGHANDPDDPGGETNFGISKRAYPDEDIPNLTLERARYLGKRDYWYPMRLDTLNCQRISDSLFDFSFHHGVRSVGKKVQLCLAREFGFKGKVDGIMGSVTLAYMNAIISANLGAPFDLHQALMKVRIDYYLNSAKPKYLAGFIKRANSYL